MPLPPFPLVNWFAAAEGRFDHSLSHSDCEPLAVSDLLNERELAEFAEFRLGYGEFAGVEPLRNIVARQYATIDKDQVLIFSGASEAIYTFMRSMLEPGDEVVAQSPLFNSLHGVARSIGCQVIDWRPSDEATCSFDANALSQLCNERTKLIVFNFPHNPTGQMISESELRLILDTARKFDAYVFSDEQFRLLELPPTPTLPAACDLYEQAISVTGVSKTLGLGGLRIGWLATRCRQVLAAAREYRYYTTEAPNTPCQILASRVLETSDQILQRNRSRILANVQSLRSFANQHRDLLVFHPPRGGTMAIVEQQTSLTSTALCEQLLDEEKVFLVPGSVLSMSDRLLRFGLGRSDFDEGLERLGQFLHRQDARRD